MNQNRAKKAPRMSGKKKVAETSEFDREFIADTFKPLSPEDQARWDRAQQGGNGRENAESAVTFHVDTALLDHIDALAEKMGVSRECLIARGIKAVLIAVGET